MEERKYTSLDAVQDLRDFQLVSYDDNGCEIDCTTLGRVMDQELNLIANDLKVYAAMKKQKTQVLMEILKKKRVDLYDIWANDTYEQYCDAYPFGKFRDIKCMLTKEEWNMAKEWMEGYK